VTSPVAGPMPVARTQAPGGSLALAAFIGVVIAFSMLVLLKYGSLLAAGMPLLLVAVGYATCALPLRVPLFAVLFLAAVSDATPLKLPNGSFWEHPFQMVFNLLFENLNNSLPDLAVKNPNRWLPHELFVDLGAIVPLSALRFSLLEVIYVLMGLLVLARSALRVRVDVRNRQRGTNAMALVLGLSFLAVLWLEVYGVGLRGGDFRQSLWQFRHLLLLPFVSALYMYALRDARDFERAIDCLTVAACIKIASAAYFFFAIARPGKFEPATLTSHYDSILYVVCVVALVARFFHAPSQKTALLLGVIGLWLLLGIAINNRRLAFVNIGVGVLLLVIMLRGPVKKTINKSLVLALPFLLLYLFAGRNNTGTIWKPARMVASVLSQSDRSSQTRDIENYNLMITIKPVKLLGTGWGHEYTERVKADDISKFFAQYRYIAHNSLLWLISIGGVVGFTVIWMPLCAGIFLARRSYVFARSPRERNAAGVALGVFVIVMMQAWGDMGTQSILTTMYLALSFAVVSKMSVATGAFPAKLRLFSRKPRYDASGWSSVAL
jgi:hypothetical protein